jgi:3'-phosphoadenosine 5'-phosphosulfate sulfotransferase (PAPS reductase)/FAD synthetase
MLVTGVRRNESKRRMGNVKEVQISGAQVWVAPIMYFDKKDVMNYMNENKITRNPVVEALHMSGECLCGAYARPGELEEIRFFYPEMAKQIEDLQEEVLLAGQKRCQWGANKGSIKNTSKMPMCSACIGEEEISQDEDLTKPRRSTTLNEEEQTTHTTKTGE